MLDLETVVRMFEEREILLKSHLRELRATEGSDPLEVARTEGMCASHRYFNWWLKALTREPDEMPREFSDQEL